MAPEPSRRRRILDAFVARLQVIERGEQFLTDAGEVVALGMRHPFGPDDPRIAVVVMPGPESGTKTQANVLVGGWPVVIEAMASVDLDEPWAMVEDLLADIKRAVELEDRTLGRLVNHRIERGPVETLEREAGTETVGLSITYLVDFVDGWGTP